MPLKTRTHHVRDALQFTQSSLRTDCLTISRAYKYCCCCLEFGRDACPAPVVVSESATAHFIPQTRNAAVFQEDEPVVVEGNDDAKYVVVFDPLDGSSNIDASIPTGKVRIFFL